MNTCSDLELKRIGFISFSNDLYGGLKCKFGSYFEVGKTLNIPSEDFEDK